MKLSERVHEQYASSRRVRVLASHFAELIPQNARLLDVGCGDGKVAAHIAALRRDVEIRGTDVLVRPDTAIPVDPFDGSTLPHPDDSFDAVLFVDVLHHSDDALRLLREAIRVARQCVLIKDHTLEGWLAGPTLRFMDRVGNARHGVALPYHYWARERWDQVFAELGLRVEHFVRDLGLYPWPASMLFGRSLHFVAHLRIP